MCLHAGCEGSFRTSKLLEEHGDVHTFSDTSRLAQYNSAVDIAYNDNTYTPPLPSTAGAPGGHLGASSEYPGLPSPVGDFPVLNNYDDNSYVPGTGSSSRAQRPSAADLPKKHNAAAFDWPDPLCSEDPIFFGRPHDFSKGSVNFIDPAHAGVRNGNIRVAHWYYPYPSGYSEQPFATDAASITHNTLLAGPTVYTNEKAVAESTIPIPTSIGNNALLNGPIVYTNAQTVAADPLPTLVSTNAPIHIDIGPATPPRPMCTECLQTFGRQSDLERHAKTHQAGPKDFQCQVAGCKYSSNRKDKFGEHVRRRHPSAGRA